MAKGIDVLMANLVLKHCPSEFGLSDDLRCKDCLQSDEGCRPCWETALAEEGSMM